MDIDQLFDEFIEFPEGSNGKYVTTVSTKLFAKYCTEKLQEENERLLFANRYNADMYRQIDDERKRLQAEVERLRNTSKQCWYPIACEYVSELEQERDQLKAAVALAVDAFRRYDMDVETYPTIEHVSMMRNLKGVLAAHDAEVIDRLKTEMMTYVAKLNMQPGVEFAVDFMDDKIDQLRQQAKEVQS